MKKLLLKTMLLLCALVAGSTGVWANTYSLTPDQSSTGSSATSYITALTEFTYNGVSWKMNQWNPKTLQIKTNQSSAASEFRFYNTSAFAGKITKVVITFSSLAVSDASKLMFLGGTSEVTAITGGTAGTWNSSAKTLTWTPGASDKFTYFAFYQNGKAASGTNNLAEADAIVVTYEIIPTGVTLSSSSLDMTVGDNDETLTATVLPAGASQTVTWTSSNPDVATVSDGVVHAVAAGNATITATTADGTKSATCDVTVSASTNPLVVISATELDFKDVEVGTPKALTFTVTPANLIGNLTIASNNSKYTVSPSTIDQSTTVETTITVTAAPTAFNDDMDGTITISGGGIEPKTVTLAAAPYQVANVSLVATDGNGTFKQDDDVVTSIISRTGNSAIIKAIPADGFTFANWTATGATPESSTNAEEEFTFTSETPVLTANFIRKGVAPMSIPTGYSLVTDASTLAEGDKLLLVSSKEDGTAQTLSVTQKANNRDGVDVTVANENIASVGATMQIINLEGSTDNWYLNVGTDQYLYAASSSSNYMRTDTKEEVGSNGKAKISIEDGVATIKFQGSNSRNWIQYNSSSALFSCYSSAQKDVYLYRLNTATSFDVTIGSTGWRTLVSANNVSLPSGVKAYIVTATGGDKATISEVASVKANTPVLLNGTPGTYAFNVIDTPAEPTGNLLQISTSNVSDNGCYVLAERNDEVGFYLWEGGSLGAGRVILPASAVSEVHEFIAIDNGTDAISEIVGDKLASTAIYDLSGRRVVKPTKGLYIVNGKKVVK